ncbi:MAG TPA: hypothetical protein VFJ30_17175, partial [Phycisphaerae bacterium]|nr:hypothetical protein [Phycisphaerae bacterium]
MRGNLTPTRFCCHVMAACALLAIPAGAARAADVYVQASGPIGAAYVGILYGLTDPADGSWYSATIDGWPEPIVSTSWTAIVDTGASACLIGTTTQGLYADEGNPIPVTPGVTWQDEGFGGTADFAVSEPVRMMIADFSLMEGDTEDHSQYAP